MPDYQSRIRIDAPAQHVYDFVSRVENLPKYLPTTKRAESEGPERIRVQGLVQDKTYDQDGYFRRNGADQRLEWGSDGEHDYHGWMDIRDMGGSCEVTVSIHLNPPAEMRQEMEQRTGNMDAKMHEGVERCLQSIKNHCEGIGGKVEQPESRNPNVSLQ